MNSVSEDLLQAICDLVKPLNRDSECTAHPYWMIA